MGNAIRVFVSGACNAFRGDGYTRSVGNYRALGETSKRIQVKRATALKKNISVTNARTKQLEK